RDKYYTAQIRNEAKGFVEDNFLKVYKHSIQTENDLSLVYSIRTHMGSHWAQMALYLNLISTSMSNKKIYQTVISGYNQGLRNNFNLKNEGEIHYYQWNS